MKVIGQLIAGLVAGAIGAYAGLWILLVATGLERPGWAPVAMLTVAALFGSLAVTFLAKVTSGVRTRLITAATGAGALIGLLIRRTSDSYEWTLAAAAAVVIGVVGASWLSR